MSFKVGDRARTTKVVFGQPFGTPGKVIEVDNRTSLYGPMCRVECDNGKTIWYYADELERVFKFNVGDKVRILAPTSRLGNKRFSVGDIKRVAALGPVGIYEKFDYSVEGMYFNEEDLELYVEPTAADFKPGDRVLISGKSYFGNDFDGKTETVAHLCYGYHSPDGGEWVAIGPHCFKPSQLTKVFTFEIEEPVKDDPSDKSLVSELAQALRDFAIKLENIAEDYA